MLTSCLPSALKARPRAVPFFPAARTTTRPEAISITEISAPLAAASRRPSGEKATARTALVPGVGSVRIGLPSGATSWTESRWPTAIDVPSGAKAAAEPAGSETNRAG